MTDERPAPRETRQEAQLRILQARYGDRIAFGPANWREVGVQYLYEPGTLLVRDGQAGEVRTRLRTLDIETEATGGIPSVPGCTRLRTGGDVMRAMDLVAEMMGPGVCSPNHLVHISPGTAGTCPATEPVPVPPGTPPSPGVSADPTDGQGVRVVVADTGLDPAAEKRSPWLAGVTGDVDEGINATPLAEYAGHGTFIAGVVRCMAPAAEVHVRATFGVGGAAFETELIEGLMSILDNDHPDIISFSAGTWSGVAQDLITLQLFGRRRLRLHKGVVLVAAAGNDGQRVPFWPAAAPYAVSVGALNSDYTGRATFSNFGGWVDAYAPGEDLVNAFPTGSYVAQEPPHAGTTFSYDGMAKWSGTSFATPVVAGLTAARMSKTGENGVEAAKALLRQAQKNAIPGLGAVVLPLDGI